MIGFDGVTVTYPGAAEPTLRDVTVDVAEGEMCLVVGRTGTGKSTLLGAICGLVPHFTGGHLAGTVTVAGRDTRDHRPRDLADVIGFVGQDPLAGFVTDTVEEELAYGMEQLAIAPQTMRKRVEETLDLLGIAELRNRRLQTLSGGQQQRVAIGSVLTSHPRILVLDEPTSALDPTAAEDVLAALLRLVHDLGITVVIAEHRLERVVHAADHILHLHGDGTVDSGPPADILATSDIAPPIVHLGRTAGWTPLPLSVRDARRLAPELRRRLEPALALRHPPEPRRRSNPPVLTARRLVVRYGSTIAVRDTDLSLHPGEIVALMGRNGAGKSSLLWALQGSGELTSGTVDLNGTDPTRITRSEARALIGLVPQTPTDLLYLATVAAECEQADRDADATEGTCAALFEQIVGPVPPDQHPRDLSEGQRLGLALAVQLTPSPPLILLDEPTRGLDYTAKDRLAIVLGQHARQGRAIVVSTHDVEFVAAVADRVVVLADGEIVADGPTPDIVIASPAFAPQVSKILAPQPWLTPGQVADALAALP